MLTLLVCAVPGLYLISQIDYLLYITGVLPAVATAIVVLVILGVGAILPHIAIISSPKKWVLPISLLVIALSFGSVALLTHHLDLHHPKTDSITYAADIDDSTAYWLSFDDSTDEWTSQFMQQRVAADSVPDFFPGGTKPHLAAKATLINLTAASVTLMNDTASRGAQFLQLLVKSPMGGNPVVLSVDASTPVISSSVDGHPIPDSVAILPTGKRDRWVLYCFGLPDSGSTITLVIPAGQKLRLTTVETVPGLPDVGGVPSCPRPGSIMRRPFVTTDAALVMKTFGF